METLSPSQLQRIRQMCRCELEAILASVCIQCYEHESDETLRSAVRSNVRDGTIDLESWGFSCCRGSGARETPVRQRRCCRACGG